MQALIRKVERREVVIIERPSVEITMGGAIAYSEDDTMESFLDKLATALKSVEAMGDQMGCGLIVPNNIEIATDGNGKFAAKMIMGR